ncbi:MAG: Smr/MutS family protein [Spirochaetaceae bacterium]|jgi:DNA mismatch repair protein MutS2|nr:Smr/MutS family protein [Spirochaetaceae bacterium]
MNGKTLKLLEFDAVRTQVADCALSGEAARRIAADLPVGDPQAVRELKRRVALVLDRLNSGDEEPRGSLPDIAAVLAKLEVEGAALEQDEAYAAGVFVERGEALRTWLRLSADTDLLTEGVPDCSALAREVFRILDRDGKLRDLPEFRDIKRRIQSLKGDLNALVSRYTNNDETRRMLQSPVPSQRDGRVVLALKANFRGRIRGIVHEVSTTGHTLFLEPDEVIEKNNDILIEERRLDAEIRRVFRELTVRLKDGLPLLEDFHNRIIDLETLRARARYSRDIRGNFADAPGGECPAGTTPVLLQARHPLLGTGAVPIDFVMNTRTVIITGPNTGGKTVALKTLGLFALMNQFGLALPAGEGTALPVFDGIYADIGDEQSLSQSLSTFSAHMTNIAAITGAAGKNSLALLDELGSGTDPEEGSAIAMSILDYLIGKGCCTVVTTHHGMLKNYGYSRPGVENASVEFDGQTLSPTYRIAMGVPGESRAVDIAARNGLPQAVIQGARSYLAEERSDVSALITELKRKHRDLDAAAAASKAEAQKLREERRRSDLRELRLRQRELILKEGGVGNLRLLLSESRKQLENLVRELKEGEINREKTVKVKEFLREMEEAVKTEAAALDEEAALFRDERRLSDAGEAAGTDLETEGRRTRKPETAVLQAGAEVLAGEHKRRGTILRPDKKGRWIVEIGSLRMTFDAGDLIPLSPPAKAPQSPLILQADLSGGTQAQFELSLRGMHLEEALETLERQIDAAVLAGLHEFSVIHGKGDGVLQKGVHGFLKRQSVVADYYFSRPELGGFGRTEVILKQ